MVVPVTAAPAGTPEHPVPVRPPVAALSVSGRPRPAGRKVSPHLSGPPTRMAAEGPPPAAQAREATVVEAQRKPPARAGFVWPKSAVSCRT
ncbi:hypothetical protein C731_4466 [Mycolicibacterium hassiacum DSM 44199]|uniref:Uncharacterized protein n=1 Tax=Mycolicibacterium hassiacum (strain DSM 44199 / CIP 105218 / JCM 12690 / 3849) TaxID=1122247 RepID=K5BDM5_MYCHD|nr:hypothetical protein C731_4466 [Mycolicibacterium hassiacum DSM 44199]